MTAAEVERLSGQGTLVRALVSRPLSERLELQNDDEISIGTGEALIRLDDKVAFVLRAGSSMVVSDVSDQAGFVTQLVRGAIRYVSGRTGSKFRVNTQHVSAGVRGTDFEITVISDGIRAGTYVSVSHGEVELRDQGTNRVITASQSQTVYARARQDSTPVAVAASPAVPAASAFERRGPPRIKPGGDEQLPRPPPGITGRFVFDSFWRIDPLASPRGEFDALLDGLR